MGANPPFSATFQMLLRASARDATFTLPAPSV